ncbi:branched-chain amino acid ABC transporter permease (plasmid) [Paracoccus yeei]|uniref:Branched-chain amino acid ABC transporter permease n=1 Tax=Paracoccus yeei TaxID=147645 RepID=A0A1V0GY66_9RHOB|nr:branched-chain amino acid ABC transporter permease [Paracoccus yeei]ARC38777.1 branched-chain amino acid ABC transporter permease [Paracoccus yeei]
MAETKQILTGSGAGRIRPHPLLIPCALLVLGLFVAIPLVLGSMPYWLTVATNACLMAFASLGVWLTFAIGRVNIAQGAFAMIGGYAVGLLTTIGGLSFWVSLPLAGLIAALVGFVIGWPLLRLRGIYFSMVTLSLTEAVRLAFLNLGNMGGWGASSGVTNIPAPPGITSPLAFYFFAAALLVLGFAGIWRLQGSRIGGVLRSMRQNEELAASIGINVALYRAAAFTICSFMGGIAGGVFASLQQNIYPQTYTVADSINMMLYCFVGGLNFVSGAIVGTFLLIVSFELLRAIQEYQALLYGVLMITLMLFLPNGVLSLTEVVRRLLGGRK